MAKRYSKKSDPHLKREREKYEHPVPSREYIIKYLNEAGGPASQKQIEKSFELRSDEEQEGLRRRLRAMIRDGQLITTRRGSFALVENMELVSGRVIGHRDGFGFLIRDDGESDIFIPAREMRQLFSDDRVLVRVSDSRWGGRGRPEASVVEILERNTHQIVGRFYREGNTSFVDPDNKYIAQDIIIPDGADKNAERGQFVVVNITHQPSRRRLPMGEVIDVLGDHLTAGMEVELAIRSHQLPFEWSDDIDQEMQAFSEEVRAEDLEGRESLEHLPLVTIDGEDARDFDDAVYCCKTEKGWRLYVAIADVAHYVKPQTHIDSEAQLRGNSVYFPAQVIPMLPEKLSNGLCSLNPDVKRLVMVAQIELDHDGDLLSSKFYEAVIRSHARLTYTEVGNILEKTSQEHKSLHEHLFNLHSLYKILHRRRQVRGAIDFDTVETKIIFGEKGKIDRIEPVVRNDAHRLIEEMMLLANVCAAKLLIKNKMPSLYRIHEGPDSDRLQALHDFLKAFGLRMSGGKKPDATDYQKLLKRVHKRDDFHLIQTVMLRSMQQAIYSPKNVGHFGLAYDAYTHFTSPIRRYPDLLVHRGLKQIIHKRKVNDFLYQKDEMVLFGEHCSMTERRADLATRDATDWLKCEYMQDKVGQEFDGRIIDVTGFGVFVELNNIYVHGLVHVTALANDYYHYDATHHLLQGKKSGKVYRLGDSMRVLVARVDLDERSIDFSLASA